MEFIVVDSKTGEIVRHGTAPKDQCDIQAFDNEFVITGVQACGDEWYVKNNKVIRKLVMETMITSNNVIANGSDIVTISNIPVGAELFINDELQGAVADGVADLSFAIAGIYNIRLELFPYLTKEYTINAV